MTPIKVDQFTEFVTEAVRKRTENAIRQATQLTAMKYPRLEIIFTERFENNNNRITLDFGKNEEAKDFFHAEFNRIMASYSPIDIDIDLT